ncbi:Neuropeptides capa receptor [Nymphon striatum]|nr:Neuropeptides capa receptor [Nymphon striatum]
MSNTWLLTATRVIPGYAHQFKPLNRDLELLKDFEFGSSSQVEQLRILSLTIIRLPNDLYVYWHQYPYIFGQVVCSVRALVSEMTSNASVLTIMAFTFERYFAICHPLKFRVFSKLTRAGMGIGGIWFLGLISSIPFAVFSEVSYVDYPPNSGKILLESAFCRMISDNDMIVPLLQFSSFAFFVLPMIVIIVLYILIGLTLNKTPCSKIQHSNPPRNGIRLDEANTQLAARRSIVKMLENVYDHKISVEFNYGLDRISSSRVMALDLTTRCPRATCQTCHMSKGLTPYQVVMGQNIPIVNAIF